MKAEKKRVYFYLAVFLVVLSIILYYFGLFKGTCEDEKCFHEAASLCSPKKYNQNVNNNIYNYVISRSFGENCKIRVSLDRSAEGTDFDTRGKLEGKSMKCLVPKSELNNVNFNEVENLLGYCTGPLKEGMYEIIIKKMYGIIISNLGEILGEVQLGLIKKV